MWSMWNAPSDRDYYGDYDEPEPEERCFDCGAGELQACEDIAPQLGHVARILISTEVK